MGAHEEWFDNPTGKIPKGSICECCGRFNARDSVSVVMVWKGDEVLLVKRDIEPKKGWWALPGGYLGWDETLEDCAMRELKEETGVGVEGVELFGVYSEPGGDGDGRQNVVHVYWTRWDGEAAVGDEVTEVGWFDGEELPEKVAFGHEKLIENYKSSGGEGRKNER